MPACERAFFGYPKFFRVSQSVFHVSSLQDDYKISKFESTNVLIGLASLIRVRHIRNLYAHEDEVFIDYDESDIVFIKDFYHRILNGQDPLTLLRKQRENTTTKIKRKTSPENIDKYIVSEEGNSSSGELTKIIIWGAVLVVLIIILLLVIIFV